MSGCKGVFVFPLFRQRFLIPLPKFIDPERSPRAAVGVLPASESTESAEKRLDTRGGEVTVTFSLIIFTGTAGGLSPSLWPPENKGFRPKGSGDIGKPGDAGEGLARSIGGNARASPSSGAVVFWVSSCGKGGSGGESDLAASACARAAAPGTALNEPMETCLLAALVLGTGSELIKEDSIVDLNGHQYCFVALESETYSCDSGASTVISTSSTAIVGPSSDVDPGESTRNPGSWVVFSSCHCILGERLSIRCGR